MSEATSMSKELDVASSFWLAQMRSSELESDVQGQAFRDNVQSALASKYVGHWYPEQPEKGQGYRAVSLDRASADPLLSDAAAAAGIKNFRRRVPADMDVTMWIDPGYVSVRYNNGNRSHVLYQAESGKLPASRKPSADKSYIDRTWSRAGAPSGPNALQPMPPPGKAKKEAPESDALELEAVAVAVAGLVVDDDNDDNDDNEGGNDK